MLVSHIITLLSQTPPSVSKPALITYILGAITAVLTLVLLAGLLAGQFRKGVVQELRDSLETANTEIEIERKRADRLDRDVKQAVLATRALESRIAALETENRVLRETLQTGLRLAPEFKDTMLTLLREHEDRSKVLIRDAIKDSLRGEV